MKKGLVHLYIGDGKGKTTAAVGLLFRAAGQNFHCGMYQFLKSSPSGELTLLKKIEVPLHRAENASAKFTWDLTSEELDTFNACQQELFDEACEDACSGEYDLLVLDEVLDAVATGAIQESELSYLIGHKHKGTELILTGRAAGKKLREAAHYITEMKSAKHPIDDGVQARRGIEY